MPAPTKSERNKQLLADYQAGLTLSQLADKYKICIRRVSQIINRYYLTAKD